jgi:hypothetical protein
MKVNVVSHMSRSGAGSSDCHAQDSGLPGYYYSVIVLHNRHSVFNFTYYCVLPVAVVELKFNYTKLHSVVFSLFVCAAQCDSEPLINF